MHLRMTGNLLLVPADQEEPAHLRVVMDLDDARRVLFVDVRRFGTGDVLLGSDALAEYFASRLGVEPLSPDFTADALRALMPAALSWTRQRPTGRGWAGATVLIWLGLATTFSQSSFVALVCAVMLAALIACSSGADESTEAGSGPRAPSRIRKTYDAGTTTKRSLPALFTATAGPATSRRSPPGARCRAGCWSGR
jgi:hypothetical protein